MKKTVAMVLTYNRLELLKECINSIRRQTVPVDKIIVVDNACTDGTAQWLKEQADLDILTIPTNLGGSLGFHTGVKKAYEQKSDWIWMMDDDAFPHKKCHENLCKAAREIGIREVVLAPIVIERDKVDHLHRGYIDFNRIQFPLQLYTNDDIIGANENLLNITFASYIGMFLSREVITKIKFPHPHYFLYQDDLEYSIRITKAGFPIFLVKNAMIHHKFIGKRELKEESIRSFTGKDYKKEKRTLTQILIDKREKYSLRENINPLLFISKRNWLWTIMEHNGMSLNLAMFLAKDVFRSSTYVLLSKANNMLLLDLFYHTYKQGLSGKFKNSEILTFKNH